jgi:hypothetical protein
MKVGTTGIRSGAFGVGPQGSVNTQDCIIHTTGPWSSPIFHGVGEDGYIVSNGDVGSGLAGILVTHSGDVPSRPAIVLNNGLLLNYGGGPCLWFGNCIADVKILSTVLVSVTTDGQPGMIMLANHSQTSPAYDNYDIVSPPNSSIRPAEVTAHLTETELIGDVCAVRGGVVELWLEEDSSWFGSTSMPDVSEGLSAVNVYMDATSRWIVTGHDAVVRELVLKSQNLSCIYDGGYNIAYDGYMNSWLLNQTRTLQNGGLLYPYFFSPTV